MAGADAIFQSIADLQNPLIQGTPPGQGEVQGTVRLEGSVSSLGGLVMVGQNVHFLNSDGSFKFTTSSGTVDITVQAPGHISIIISNVQINPGEVLTIPDLTLPFGDANGDGKIDILDLSLAANNFGETAPQITLP